MSILCGTDFSEGAERAQLAAALLAARRETKLHLMHCVQFSSEVLGAQLKEAHIEWMNDLLRRQADAARACGADVQVANAQQRGYRTVVSLLTEEQTSAEAREAQRLGLRFVSIPIPDAAALTQVNAERLARAMDAPQVKPLLLDCASGNR